VQLEFPLNSLMSSTNWKETDNLRRANNRTIASSVCQDKDRKFLDSTFVKFVAFEQIVELFYSKIFTKPRSEYSKGQ